MDRVNEILCKQSRYWNYILQFHRAECCFIMCSFFIGFIFKLRSDNFSIKENDDDDDELNNWRGRANVKPFTVRKCCYVTWLCRERQFIAGAVACCVSWLRLRRRSEFYGTWSWCDNCCHSNRHRRWSGSVLCASRSIAAPLLTLRASDTHQLRESHLRRRTCGCEVTESCMSQNPRPVLSI